MDESSIKVLARTIVCKTIDVVLCEIENEATPYVTWLHNKYDGGYHLGHYYRNSEMARNDYEMRVLQKTLKF
jgi:hypothetical protein